MNPALAVPLFVVLIPGAIAAGLLALAGWGRPRDGHGASWAGAVALGGAFGLALLWTESWQLPGFPGVRADAERWFWVALPAVGLGVAEPRWSRARWRWVVRGVAALVVGLFLFWGPLTTRWGLGSGAGVLAAMVVAALTGWAGLDRAAGHPRRTLSPWLAVLVTGVAALTIGAGGSAKVAMPVGAMAAAAGVGFLLGAWQPRLTPGVAMAAPVALLTTAGLAFGVLFAELPWGAALLVCAVPGAAMVAAPLAVRLGRFGPWLAPAGAAGLLAGAALALTVLTGPPLTGPAPTDAGPESDYVDYGADSAEDETLDYTGY